MIKEKINWGLQVTGVCAVYYFSVKVRLPRLTLLLAAMLLNIVGSWNSLTKKRKEGRMSHHLQKFLHNSSILYLYLRYKLPIFHHDDEILTFIRRHGRREHERANEETLLSKILNYWAPLWSSSGKTSLTGIFISVILLNPLLYFWAIGTLF